MRGSYRAIDALISCNLVQERLYMAPAWEN